MKAYTCFKMNVDDLIQQVNRVLSSSPPMHFKSEKITDIYTPILEYNPKKKHFLIWEPLNSKGYSVFAPNMEDGWFTLINIVSTKCQCETASVRISPLSDEYPICELVTYQSGKQRRIIRVMKDEKWEFYEDGEPYNFEETNNYKKRLKKERFNEPLLNQYLNELGWEITSPNFYQVKEYGYIFNEIVTGFRDGVRVPGRP